MKKIAMFMRCVPALAMAIAVMPAAAQDKPPAKEPVTQQNSKSSPAPDQTSSATSAQSGSALKDQKEKISYAIGMNVGASLRENLRRASVEVDTNLVFQAARDVLSGDKTLLTQDEAKAILTQLQNDIRAKMEEKHKQEAEANKKEGDAFLAQNKTKEGVIALPSGLQYKILTTGSGPKPTADDTVVCNYQGTLIDGKEFDSSYKRGQPATFPVKGVIKGWTEALQLMPTGSKWQLFIPADMAYGESGQGDTIPPNATLIFTVELISIKEKK
jgi:FKBP-type peptidyl-prolyl cis-trans isomerase